jgi:hypothetical protein
VDLVNLVYDSQCGGLYEDGNESSGSVKGGAFYDELRNCSFLKGN